MPVRFPSPGHDNPYPKAKTFRGSVRIAPVLLFAVVLSGCQGEAEDGLARFAESYRERHAAGDVEGLLELIALPEDSPDLRRFVVRTLSEETRWPLKDIQAARLPSRERRDLRHDYPLPPLWRVYVILDTEDRFTSVWLAGRGEEGVKLLVAPEGNRDQRPKKGTAAPSAPPPGP